VQRSLPLLRAAAAADPERGAKVIALASITGVYAEPGLAVYGATKAALISFMETLNAEESAHGVTATAIAPGYVDTDMSAWVTDTIPAHAMIPVADVVAVADMLLSLSPRTAIPTIVMARSGTNGYRA
jgi:3-oxoacyl-[acyl-carrier protein] reductase